MDSETRLQFELMQEKLSKLLKREERKSETANQNADPNTLPAFINLREAMKLKGGSDSLSTYRTNYAVQPAMGTNSVRVCGVRCWSRDIILEWLTITDDQLPAYAEKWGVPLPEKYKKYQEEVV